MRCRRPLKIIPGPSKKNSLFLRVRMADRNNYWDMHELVERLKVLQYPRFVSIESFRRPNFELVIDILEFCLGIFDENVQLGDDIFDETQRVKYLTKLVEEISLHFEISLDAYNLYCANENAVPELLVLLSYLSDGYNETSADDRAAQFDSWDENLMYIENRALLNCERFERLANDRVRRLRAETETLQNLIETETAHNRAGRETANKNLMELMRKSANDGQFIENLMQKIIRQDVRKKEVASAEFGELETAEKRWTNKREKIKNDIQNLSAKIFSLRTKKTPIKIQHEKLMQEFSYFYQIFCEKHQNLMYLENLMTEFYKQERMKFDEERKNLALLHQKIRKQTMEMLKGDGNFGDATSEQSPNANDRPFSPPNHREHSANTPKKSNHQNYYQHIDEMKNFILVHPKNRKRPV